MRVWVRFWVGLTSVFAVSVVCTLALWATLVPTVIGWKPVSIVSGSMEPLIGMGDVVLAEPYEDQELEPGTVIVFEDQVWDGLMTHRIHSIDQQGSFITKGDANVRPDSTPVDRDAVVGVGRVLVPEIGWPAAWAAKGDKQSLVVLGAAWLLTLYAARWGALERYDPWARQMARGPVKSAFGRGRHLRRPQNGPLRSIVGMGSALGATAAVLTLGLSSAVLATTTSNDSNQLLASDFQPPSNLQLNTSCSAGAAITLRGAATAGGQGASFVLTKPAGTVVGDVMLTQIVLRDNDPITAPTGWSLVRRSGSGLASAIYVKVAGPAEPASYSWALPNTSRYAAGVASWANVDNVTPVNAHGGAGGSGSSIVAPSLTTTAANTMLVAFWSIRDNAGVTIPGSMTKRWELNSAQGGNPKQQVQSTAGTEAFAPIGATGARTATSPVSEENLGQMVALRPASSGTSRVDASWTATPSLFATGHKLQRWLGAVQETEQTITPRTVTTAADTSVVGGLTYEYRLFAYYGSSWTSSEVSNTITVASC